MIKTLLVLFFWTSGAVGTLWAASSEETNGKLKLGDPIPTVTSKDQNGKPVDLAQVGGTGYTLVYFYPRAQKEFVEKDHLPFQLLSDTDRQVTSAFGVPLMKNAFATRQAYLFKDGKLVWLDTKASTDKQAQDVLAALQSH
jgi:peroxiredoxin Q/BCP